MEAEGQVIRVGSRKSELALIQTNHVIECLHKVYPEIKFEIVTMTTLGDRILNVSLPKIGEKSLFTRDLEDALLRGSVHFVVHSLKDLPTTLPEGLAIGAVFEREDPRDALVLRDDLSDKTLGTLPPQSCIGTSSLRRTAQLRARHPHLRIVDVRGNLNTRLRKLQNHSSSTTVNVSASGSQTGNPDKSAKTQSIENSITDNDFKTDNDNTESDSKADNGAIGGNSENRGDVKMESLPEAQEYSALILAQAGLVRMGWQDRISQVLPCSEMMYAVGQGALAVECRADNAHVLSMLASFNHPESYCRILVERSFLKTLGGGCSAPVGVSTSLKPFDKQHRLTISGAVWSLDGATKVHDRMEHIFSQVRRNDPSKHTLSPTEESGSKKLKVDMEQTSNLVLNRTSPSVNPIEAYNRKITEFHGKNENSNCEDTRSVGEIQRLVDQSDGREGSVLNLEQTSEKIKVSKKESGNGVASQNVRLFCGLTENVHVLTEVIEKCDEIGQELAKSLIGKGALEVMKISQDYIRSSLKKL